jgi:hypothetical protein
MSHPNYPRWRQHVGPVTIKVEPGKVTFDDGRIVTTGMFGQPLTNPLAVALRMSRSHDVIGLRGVHPGLRIGSINQGDWDSERNVMRPGLEPLPTVTIVPDDDVPEQPTIAGGISIAGSGSNARGGIEDLTLAGLKILNGPIDKYNILVEQQIETGRLRVLYNDMGSLSPAAWQGWGKMWGVRANGLLRLVKCIGNTFSEALEHAVWYGDNAGYESTSEPHEISGNETTGRGGGRTCIQWVNRQNSGRKSGGVLRMENNDLRCIGGNGGGAVTIAGHTGRAALRANRMTLEGPHSGLTVWSDAGKGLYYTDSGHTLDNLLVDGISVEGGNRPHVSISGARRVRIEQSFRLKRGDQETAEHCIELDGPNGGPVANGPVEFINCTESMSSYTGFQSGARVVRDSVVLSSQQIDAMVPLEPGTVGK